MFLSTSAISASQQPKHQHQSSTSWKYHLSLFYLSLSVSLSLSALILAFLPPLAGFTTLAICISYIFCFFPPISASNIVYSATKTSASELNYITIIYLGRLGEGFHPAGWKFTKAFGENWPTLLLILGHLSALEIIQHLSIVTLNLWGALQSLCLYHQSPPVNKNLKIPTYYLFLKCLYACIQLTAGWALGVHCALFSFCTLWTCF